jgi:ribulose 1,5-bisphosphate carboxylase large subunit-like protein
LCYSVLHPIRLYNNFDDTKTDDSIFYYGFNNIDGADIIPAAASAASANTITSRAAIATAAEDVFSTLLKKAPRTNSFVTSNSTKIEKGELESALFPPPARPK